jgi:hypothetical protein
VRARLEWALGLGPCGVARPEAVAVAYDKVTPARTASVAWRLKQSTRHPSSTSSGVQCDADEAAVMALGGALGVRRNSPVNS